MLIDNKVGYINESLASEGRYLGYMEYLFWTDEEEIKKEYWKEEGFKIVELSDLIEYIKEKEESKSYVKLGKKIHWTEAIKQMSLGRMCAVTHYGTNTFFLMCDSMDEFRAFDLTKGVFLNHYLDADDIKEGVWSECTIK